MAKSRLQEELGKKNPFEAPEQEAFLNLARTLDFVSQNFVTLFADHGISGPQYNVLRILRGMGGPGVPSQEIGGRMITRMPDVTRLVDRLVESGLVERTRTKRTRTMNDRRLVLVRLTEAGADLLRKLDVPVLELHRKTLGHLKSAELEELNRLLVKARHPEEG
jgi:DNA-binding MarR family transcriptional regulator